MQASEAHFASSGSVYIEDCLDSSNNVARAVDAAGRRRVSQEFVRAYDVLCRCVSEWFSHSEMKLFIKTSPQRRSIVSEYLHRGGSYHVTSGRVGACVV